MPKVVCILNNDDAQERSFPFDDSCDVLFARDPGEALALMQGNQVEGVYLCCDGKPGSQTSEEIFDYASVIDLMPDGIAILDNQKNILRANKRLTEWFENRNPVGLNFYEAFGSPTIVGSDPSPLSTASAKMAACKSIIEVNDKYFRLAVVPVADQDNRCCQIVVCVVDATESFVQRQKLKALHQAGTALADLRPEEIYQMDVQCRIELLKDNILHYTKDLLNFDVVEIRLIDFDTNLLTPLLSVGIDSTRAKQPLYATTTGNGVTGFVAATGKSYMCEDTTNDPLYVAGLMGAKSSLTVPLIYQEEVIGSFNVESPEIRAFTDSDLQFVESFAHDIAVALNTLELLNAEQANTAIRSIDAIHSAVALPIDQILNDTVLAIDNYAGTDQEVKQRLQDILINAREIKRVIQNVAAQFAPDKQPPGGVQTEVRPKLKDKRVLVIDADEEIRTSAHKMLERLGCIVETAHEGREAISMVRNSLTNNSYDAIIADIRLPDIGGYELLIKLKEIVEDPPLILMSGFGYDPGHSIVKARQAGLKANAVYKPFRIDQIIETVEATVQGTATADK